MNHDLLRWLSFAALLSPLSTGCSGAVTFDDGGGASPASGGSSSAAGGASSCSDADCVIEADCADCGADANCGTNQWNAYNQAAANDCGDEWVAFKACFIPQKTSCAGGIMDPCFGVLADLEKCMPAYHDGAGGPYAAQGPCHGSYTSKKLNWTVDCVLNGIAFDCTCTSGPKSGTTFQLNNCSMGWTKVAEPHCT